MGWREKAVEAAKEMATQDLTESQMTRLALFVIAVIGGVFVAWTFGAFERFGLGGGFAPATASTALTELKTKVETNSELIEKNSEAIADLTRAQAQSSEDVDDLVLELLEQRMRSIINARCRTVDPTEWQRLNEDLDRLQRRYATRNHSARYPERGCDR